MYLWRAMKQDRPGCSNRKSICQRWWCRKQQTWIRKLGEFSVFILSSLGSKMLFVVANMNSDTKHWFHLIVILLLANVLTSFRNKCDYLLSSKIMHNCYRVISTIIDTRAITFERLTTTLVHSTAIHLSLRNHTRYIVVYREYVALCSIVR